MSEPNSDYVMPTSARYSNVYAFKSLQPCFVRSTIRNTADISGIADHCRTRGWMLQYLLRHRTALSNIAKRDQRTKEEMLKQLANSFNPAQDPPRTAPGFAPEQSADLRARGFSVSDALSPTLPPRPGTAVASSPAMSCLQQEIFLAHQEWSSQPKLKLRKLFKKLKREATKDEVAANTAPAARSQEQSVNQDATPEKQGAVSPTGTEILMPEPQLSSTPGPLSARVGINWKKTQDKGQINSKLRLITR